MQCWVLGSHLTSLLSALWSLSCIVQAGCDVERKTGSKGLGLCWSCGVSLGMGDPCSKNPFWMPWSSVWALCCISSLHHAKLHAWGRLWQRAGVWEVCHSHNGSETWAQPSQGGQDLRQRYSILPFILHDKHIACKILQTTHQKAKQESLWV